MWPLGGSYPWSTCRRDYVHQHLCVSPLSGIQRDPTLSIPSLGVLVTSLSSGQSNVCVHDTCTFPVCDILIFPVVSSLFLYLQGKKREIPGSREHWTHKTERGLLPELMVGKLPVKHSLNCYDSQGYISIVLNDFILELYVTTTHPNTQLCY